MNANVRLLIRAAAALMFAAGAGLARAGDVDIQMTSADGTTKVSFQDSSSAEVASVDSDGNLTSSSMTVVGTLAEFSEVTSPPDPAANKARVYSKDIGGTTYMAYRDSAGTERVLRPYAVIPLVTLNNAVTNIGAAFVEVNNNVVYQPSRHVVDFTGFTEARIVFRVDNNQADTIECRIQNITDAAQVCSGISDGTANAQDVTGAWTAINLTGDKTVQVECHEGAGATADPDFGVIALQLR